MQRAEDVLIDPQIFVAVLESSTDCYSLLNMWIREGEESFKSVSDESLIQRLCAILNRELAINPDEIDVEFGDGLEDIVMQVGFLY